MIRGSILEAIGETPLIRFRRLFDRADVELFGKLEGANPGGSIKDRPARLMLERGLASGLIRASTVVIESSSGNMGVGLAQACAYHGLRFICVVDPRTTPQHLRLLSAYGAEIDLVREPDPRTGEFLPARFERVRELMAEHEDACWPDQFTNEVSWQSHAATTMREIAEALDGRVDYVFCATSTCGTIRGCAEYCRAQGLATRIVAVDATGSAIFSQARARRVIPGLGAGIIPPLLQRDLVDEVIPVSAADCVAGCRRLARREAVLGGGSSGAIVAAVERVVERLVAGSRCVLILSDRGERYLDSVYSDAWVAEHIEAAPT